jgi:hypothetical protein
VCDQLLRGGLGQADQCRLARCIDSGPRRSATACAGRNIHDRPAPSVLDHLARDRGHREQGSARIHAHHAIELIERRIDEHLHAEHACAVHEDVDAPGGVLRAIDHCVDRAPIAHVEYLGHGPRSDLATRRFAARLRDIGNDDLCALLVEALSDRVTDAARTARHDRYPARQSAAHAAPCSAVMTHRPAASSHSSTDPPRHGDQAR